MGGRGVTGWERTGSFLLVLADIRIHTQASGLSSPTFFPLAVLVVSLPQGHPLSLPLE